MMNRILFSSCIIAGVLVFTSVVNAQIMKGTPGVDYPNYQSIPETSFKCSEQKFIPGFYADLETNCQVFHFCFKDQQEAFLCSTGTTFNQEKLACDFWFTSNCSLSPLFHNVNDGPAIKSASKKLPMLLRNRSRDKTQRITNIYETLSALRYGNTDSTLHKRVGTVNSLNANETSLVNNTDGDISKESSFRKAEPESESVQSLSDQPILEENFQNDSNEDYSNIELDVQDDLVYDSVTDGYYVYDQEEWHQDPESEEFSTFYDTMGDYGVPFQDNSYDWSEDEETSESSDGLDLNNISEETDDSEFSKRRLAEQQFKPHRRRQMYVVLEDEESEFPIKVLDSETGLHSFEDATVETNEVASELPFGSEESKVEETEEENQEFTEDLRMKFPYYPEYVTENTLASEEFADVVTEFAFEKGRQFNENEAKSLEENMLQSENEQVEEFVADEADFEDASAYVEDEEESSYESDSLEFNLQDNFNKGRESDLYLNVDVDQGDYDTKIESEDEAGSVDDTYVIIPDESDASSYSLIDDAGLDETEYKDRLNEYTLDINSNVQMDGPQLMKGSDEYEHYRLYRNRPDFPELVDSKHKLQRPYTDGVYYRPMHNTYYTPSVARESLQQGDQRMLVMDPVYGTGNEYVYGNFYDPYTGQMSGYYEPEKSRQHYPSADVPWYQNSDEDVEFESQLGVTDEPSIGYSTEFDLQNSEETLVTTMSSDQEDSYTNEFYEDPEKLEETYYVLDLDEDEQVDANIKDSGNETSFYNVRSDEVGAKETFEKLPFESGDPSVSTGISFDEGTKSSGQVDDFQSNELGSLDSFLTSQSDSKVQDFNTGIAFNSKPQSDSWPSLVTESSATDDQAVTFSSTLERLASLQNTKPIQPPSFNNLEFSSDTRFMNNMAFPESMDFGPYGYGANMGQQYNMLNSMQAGQQGEAFSHRTGETEKPNLSKLTSIQERLRSMKQGKFGVFKKYMNTMKN